MEIRDIFNYTEPDINKFLSTMEIENIQNYNLKEKRCLTLYYLYVEYSLNLEEIDHYGGFDKILNSFKFYDTFETFTYYICSSVCSYNKMILNKNKLK